MTRAKQSISSDFRKIAKVLREDAVTAKNSHYNSKWGWTPLGRKEEYDELRRLARVASAMASQLAKKI